MTVTATTVSTCSIVLAPSVSRENAARPTSTTASPIPVEMAVDVKIVLLGTLACALLDSQDYLARRTSTIANHPRVTVVNALTGKTPSRACAMLVTPDSYARRKSTNANRTRVNLAGNARIWWTAISVFVNRELLDQIARLMSMSVIAIRAEMERLVLMALTDILANVSPATPANTAKPTSTNAHLTLAQMAAFASISLTASVANVLGDISTPGAYPTSTNAPLILA